MIFGDNEPVETDWIPCELYKGTGGPIEIDLTKHLPEDPLDFYTQNWNFKLQFKFSVGGTDTDGCQFEAGGVTENNPEAGKLHKINGENDLFFVPSPELYKSRMLWLEFMNVPDEK